MICSQTGPHNTSMRLAHYIMHFPESIAAYLKALTGFGKKKKKTVFYQFCLCILCNYTQPTTHGQTWYNTTQ